MIESKDGIVKVKGKLFEIKADLSAIINSLRKNLSENMRQDEADKHIRDAVDKGFMTEDEIVKKIEELAKQIPDELKELVNVMLSVGGDADEVK